MMGERSFSEADVLGWEVRETTDYLMAVWKPGPGQRDEAEKFAVRHDSRRADFAPHRVCAVVEWKEDDSPAGVPCDSKEDNDG